MPTLVFGILVLVLALWALNIISKVDPKIGARVLKAGGGLLALGFAVFLGLRGELAIALPLGAFGLGLLGWIPFGPAGFSERVNKTARAAPRACARPLSRWSSITTAARCAAASSPAAIKA